MPENTEENSPTSRNTADTIKGLPQKANDIARAILTVFGILLVLFIVIAAVYEYSQTSSFLNTLRTIGFWVIISLAVIGVLALAFGVFRLVTGNYRDVRKDLEPPSEPPSTPANQVVIFPAHPQTAHDLPGSEIVDETPGPKM